jgi:alpha,alpha-trehalose phosphorylase
VIPDRHFPPEPWLLRAVGYDPAVLAQSESLFTLSNGHIGVRGNLDEGEPSALPGTYLNSFYETRPLPYAEAAYGDPESGETIINVTDGKLIRLLVDDQPFDISYGDLLTHERTLDFRAGTLDRVTEWRSRSGTRVAVRTSRLVSLTQRAILAIRFEVEPLDGDARIVLQSELRANEQTPTMSGDPREAAALEHPLNSEQHGAQDRHAHLVHRTQRSNNCMAVAMDHHVDGLDDGGEEIDSGEDWARYSVGTTAAPGRPLILTKFVAYGWSSKRTPDALRDQVAAALLIATHVGWDGLVAEQAKVLDEFWAAADVEIDGPVQIQQAVRFALFHGFQASVRSERRPIPAKGLTGPGYDGHVFWDTEAFVLPMLTATAPKAVADAVRWRHDTIDLARDRAHALRLRGAVFPWRTINGAECSGYWPAGTAAFHINGDIGLAAARYVHWTGDQDVDRDHVLPLLIEIARLWTSLGHLGNDGQFHIDGVTGPDEYSAIADDNVYTNLTARQNLLDAVAATKRWPNETVELGIHADETDQWAALAQVVAVPFDEVRKVHQQDRGFTDKQVWDFAASASNNEYPLLLHVPYFDLYRKQVIKQSDLVLAMHWHGKHFTAEQKALNFAYYEPLTVRDSSLSACTQAVIAAEVGHLELAADYLAEAALMDLADLEHNVRDGLHIASLAGSWLALVAGFGGLRDWGEVLSFAPQLPPGWSRLTFNLRWRGNRLKVEISPVDATYSLNADDGPGALQIQHWGTLLDLTAGQRHTLPWQRVTPLTARPAHPAGREPVSATELT